ncbi:5-formyltetrahydrofolate cyclo-ligase [Gorillibacterium sp. CAU 1737]|uniref:5-formyltetrahydrofolate cyclo-ligase n=1 Tax=Gorillibacterium sp. CAU 1737 TaxID=3140362 RepID=UPI0032619ED1
MLVCIWYNRVTRTGKSLGTERKGWSPMQTDLREAKKSLREQVLKLRSACSEEERKERSARLVAQLKKEFSRRWTEWSLPDHAPAPVLIYFPFGTEADLLPAIEWLWKEGIPTAAPRTLRDPRQLVWYRVGSLDDVEPGTWGILEPKRSCEKVPEEELQRTPLVLLPGVAFDSHGGRLGYGAGYYDRFLDRMAAPDLTERLVAAAYELQVRPEVPTERHDVRIGTLVTESRTLRFC